MSIGFQRIGHDKIIGTHRTVVNDTPSLACCRLAVKRSVPKIAVPNHRTNITRHGDGADECMAGLQGTAARECRLLVTGTDCCLVTRAFRSFVELIHFS